MSQFFASGGQSTGVSALASVLPMNIQDRFPLGWTGWISLQSKGLSRVFSNTIVQKHQFFSTPKKKKKKKACQRQNQQLTFTRCFFCDFFRWLSTLPILSHLIPKRGSYEMNIIISSLQMNKVRYKMIKKCSKSLTVNQL